MDSHVEVLWKPAGMTLDSLGSKKLVDTSDGDTPNIRMPIRMLSVDTPEVTAKSKKGAKNVDKKFAQLAEWIEQGVAPVTETFAAYILPRLKTGQAGTLQYQQGKEASAFLASQMHKRLMKKNGSQRPLFVRTADERFDKYGRLLAYVSPSYSEKERAKMSRRERASFNLDLIESGHAMPFVLFPSIPGELDLPMMIDAAVMAMQEKKGQYQHDLFLPAYEYRACEDLYELTQKIVKNEKVKSYQRYGWRSRYCADMRERSLYGPENYTQIPHPFRLWIWPKDIQRAIAALNLTPARNGFT